MKFYVRNVEFFSLLLILFRDLQAQYKMVTVVKSECRRTLSGICPIEKKRLIFKNAIGRFSLRRNPGSC